MDEGAAPGGPRHQTQIYTLLALYGAVYRNDPLNASATVASW